MLKAPSARREGNSRRNSTKRDSGEFKESPSIDSLLVKESVCSDQPVESIDSQEMATAKVEEEEGSSQDVGNPESLKTDLVQAEVNDCKCTEMSGSQCDTDISKMKVCPNDDESQCGTGVSKIIDHPDEIDSHCDKGVPNIKDCPAESESQCSIGASKI
jgi:hypothetical protein